MPRTLILYLDRRIRLFLTPKRFEQDFCIVGHSPISYPIDASIHIIVLIRRRNQNCCDDAFAVAFWIGRTESDVAPVVLLATAFAFVVFELAHAAAAVAAGDVCCRL